MPIIFQPDSIQNESIAQTLSRWTDVGVINKNGEVRKLIYSKQGASHVVKTTDLFEFLMGDE